MPGKNFDPEPAQPAGRRTDKNSCIHTWSIEPPNGPTSRGTCADCGATKEFHNSVEMSYWDNRRKHVPENHPPKNRAAANARANSSGANKPARNA